MALLRSSRVQSVDPGAHEGAFSLDGGHLVTAAI